jgi:hypothetical protein
MYLFLFLTLYMFRAHLAHNQERQIVNTTSGSRHSGSVAVSRADGSTCTRHGHQQLPEVVLTQFVSPEDEHDVLETCRDLKIKINT